MIYTNNYINREVEVGMLRKIQYLYKRQSELFAQQMDTYWSSLSHATNLLIILNISLFFVTELVTVHGYYYTYYSLLGLIFVQVGLLFPLGLLNKLWYYCIFLFSEIIAIYFLISSIWFWVATNKVI